MRAAVTDDESLAAGHGALPLWAPLPLLFPADEAAWAIKDEFLFGPSLLVAPVVVEGAVSRAVHLPPGRWVAFPMPGAAPGTLGASRDEFAGDDVDIEVDAALGEVPVFVVAGGIVPMTATAPLTLREVPGIDLDLSSTSGDRTVVVALGNDGRFVEEDGAEYELTGTGTALPAGAAADGSIVVVGNQAVSADGFTFTLRGHPATRSTRVVFR
jgi:alpha-glucosidase (family GH31 glycosyl hydrolase)